MRRIELDRLLMGDIGGITVYIKDPDDGMKVLRDKNRDMLFFWCQDNCKGKYWIGMGFGKFELQEDATLFALRWKQ